MIEIGQIYKVQMGKPEITFDIYCLLSLVDGPSPIYVNRPLKVCLINIVNGNRLNNPITIKDDNNITNKEFTKIVGKNNEAILIERKDFKWH